MAYIAALLSALAMAGVYLTDALMAEDRYNRPSQPLIISSVFSFLPAPLLLLLGWQMPSCEAATMALLAGIVLMLANWMYFIVLFSDVGEATETALYECASVVAIAFFVGSLNLFNIPYHEEIGILQWIGVGIAVAGLVGMHVLGEKIELVDWKHRIMLLGFMFGGAAYELAIDRAIYLAAQSMKNDEQAAFIAVSPFFWAGLSSGIIVLLSKKERTAFRKQWAIILSSWRLILLGEIFALIAFCAVLFGFAKGHLVVVSLLAGSFPVFVFVGEILLVYGGLLQRDVLTARLLAKKIASIAAVIAGSITASTRKSR